MSKDKNLIIPNKSDPPLSVKTLADLESEPILNRITEVSRKIVPLRVIAASVSVWIEGFIETLRKSPALQGAIIEGEYQRLEKEWQTYEAFLTAFETGKELKGVGGNVIVANVTPMILGARMKFWDIFWKRFIYTAFMYRQDSYGIQQQKGQEESEYMKLKEQIVNRMNRISGTLQEGGDIPKTKDDLTFNPNHYAHSMLLNGLGRRPKAGSFEKMEIINPALKRKGLEK